MAPAALSAPYGWRQPPRFCLVLFFPAGGRLCFALRRFVFYTLGRPQPNPSGFLDRHKKEESVFIPLSLFETNRRNDGEGVLFVPCFIKNQKTSSTHPIPSSHHCLFVSHIIRHASILLVLSCHDKTFSLDVKL